MSVDKSASSPVKSAVGEEKYEEFRALIQAVFPGSPRPDDATVDAFIRAASQSSRGIGGVDLGLPELPPEPEEAPAERGLGAPSYPLFMAHAQHHRTRSMTTPKLGAKSNVPFDSDFIGHLPVVRVPLPQRYSSTENPTLKTQIGDVRFSSDHLVGSVELIGQKFGPQLGYKPGKVDLITPAAGGIRNSRFGAIAAYLGYRNASDADPSFYILEAGMATGEPKVLFLGETLETVITQRSGYDPTAYSSHNNFYSGGVTVKNNQLTYMWVMGGPKDADNYIQVTVHYEAVSSTSNDPTALLVQAAQRIALIGENMGVPSGVPLQSLMAKAATLLDWIHQPGYGSTSRSLGDEKPTS